MQNQAGPNQTTQRRATKAFAESTKLHPSVSIYKATYTKTVAIDSRRFQIYSHFCSAVWLYRKKLCI